MRPEREADWEHEGTQIRCEICDQEGRPQLACWFSSVDRLNEHTLAEHSAYKNAKPIFEREQDNFDRLVEQVTWLMLNRKGAKGNDSLLFKWYETDFLDLWRYSNAIQGFIPTGKTIPIPLVCKLPSPDSIIRARQWIHEQAMKRIMEANRLGRTANKEDVLLLPSNLTLLKRRKREAVYTILMAERQRYGIVEEM